VRQASLQVRAGSRWPEWVRSCAPLKRGCPFARRRRSDGVLGTRRNGGHRQVVFGVGHGWLGVDGCSVARRRRGVAGVQGGVGLARVSDGSTVWIVSCITRIWDFGFLLVWLVGGACVVEVDFAWGGGDRIGDERVVELDG
jgi:hypothetical protein